ncbi:MAG TPA: glycosyltransferase family 87 protein [Acidobacteriaceae bacterium]
MSNSARSLPSPFRWLCGACVALTVFSWIFASIYFRCTQEEWASVWSHDPQDAFGDFLNYSDLFQVFHTREFFFSEERFAYPAPSAVVFSWLYGMGPYQLQIFLGSVLASGIAACCLFRNALVRAGVAAGAATIFAAGMALSSWPFLFLYERANLEFIIWLLAALGIWALLRERPMLAAVLFGLGASLKLYPILLLALFFSRRYIRELFVGLTIFALSMLASFWFVGPTIRIAFHGTLSGISGFVTNYAATAHSEIQFDHSFLGAIKQILIHRPWQIEDFTFLTHGYVIVAGLGAALLFLLRVRHMPFINRVLFLTICMVALPPVSYDYTLVHLCIPFALFTLAAVRAAGQQDSQPGMLPALVCFAVLFTPQLFLFYDTLHLNGLLKSAAMATLVVLLARYPIYGAELSDEDAIEDAEPVYA